jgi:hypothetical protein
MIDSKGSVVVGRQGSRDRLAGAVVVPDRGGQGQHTFHDAGPHSGRGAAAVLFQVELMIGAKGCVLRSSSRATPAAATTRWNEISCCGSQGSSVTSARQMERTSTHPDLSSGDVLAARESEEAGADDGRTRLLTNLTAKRRLPGHVS